jgi:acyl-CoA synthetase (AMP-forming)/AMP-acid ligase II
MFYLDGVALNIADLIEHAVDVVGDRVALVCGDERITYGELEGRVNRLAHHLAANGVGAGDHVGVYCRNRIEAVEAMIAAYKLRAVAINVNYRYTSPELRYLFDDADMVALVHERAYSERVAAALPDVPKLKHVVVVEDGSDADFSGYGGIAYADALASSSDVRDFPERSADDLYLLYTGGTTGNPKGVMWRHEDVWRVLGGGIDFLTGEPVADEWQQSQTGAQNPGLVRLPVPPMIHGAAQWAAFQSLFSGGTCVLVPHFEAAEIWRTVQREKVNVMLIVGDAMARPMIEEFTAGDYDASSLYAIASSAALFSTSVKQQFLAALPNLILTDSIGSSETGFSGMGIVQKDQVKTSGPRVKADPDTVVVDANGKLAEPGGGTVGLLGRTGNIPLGYYKDEEKTAALYQEIDGKRYVFPGDFARLEDDGTISLLGRGNVCINTGGEKVFPEEVENALKAHADVFDALVIGVADERLGQRVGALIAARGDRQPRLSDVDGHMRERLAGYKAPRSVWFVDEIVRSPSGKPDYRWAKRYAEQNAEAAKAENS